MDNALEDFQWYREKGDRPIVRDQDLSPDLKTGVTFEYFQSEGKHLVEREIEQFAKG